MSQHCGHGGEHLSPFTSALACSLNTACNPARAPDLFDEKLEIAVRESDSSFPRILLRAGFQVWFAYLVSQQRDANGLHLLPPTDLEVVTGAIARIHPHDTVRGLFSHLFHGTNPKRKKRRSLLESINVNVPEESTSADERPSKRARTSIQDLAIHPSGGPMVNTDPSQRSATDTSNTEHGGQGGAASDFHSIYGSIGFDFDSRSQLAWPSASYLWMVFPVYLASVIVKTENKAAWLRASFPGDFTKCELEFFISASAIQHIAKELFDLHIDIRDQQRGILLDNDVFVKVDGSLTLTGSPLGKVEKLLGVQATQAYQISPSRSEELNNGQAMKTNCLSMQLWPEIDCPSRLRLKVEVGKLTSITGQLWPTSMSSGI
ncbi:hypothetical protein LZ31DRAFT_560918 [Colletotrichum somersetense]|nr:hypothetical protein LZ31DRAFT_560918 [Colletotrichum somersetense]